MNVWSDTKSISLCLLAYLGTIMEGNHLKIASTVDSAEPFCWRIEDPYMAAKRLTTVFCSVGLVAAPVPTHPRLCCCSSHSNTLFMQLSFGLSNLIFRYNYLPPLLPTRSAATLTPPNPLSYISDPPSLLPSIKSVSLYFLLILYKFLASHFLQYVYSLPFYTPSESPLVFVWYSVFLLTHLLILSSSAPSLLPPAPFIIHSFPCISLRSKPSPTPFTLLS